MYIPEFWCGVAVTVAAMAVLFFVYGFILNKKENKKREGKNDQQNT